MVRDYSDWSLYLPLVQYLINTRHSVAIGTSPARLVYGDYLLGAECLSTVPLPPRSESRTVEEFIQKLNEKFIKLLMASDAYQQKRYVDRLSKNPTAATNRYLCLC